MPKTEFVIKSLPAVRLAARTGVADLDSSIGPIVESLFDEAARAVNDAGGSLKVAVAHYEPTPGGTRVIAGYEYAGPPTDGVEIILLPSVDHAVCGVHLGNTAAVPSTWHHLMSHLESSGLSPAPFCRENYLEAEGENQSAWVIELQQPIVT